MSALIGHNGAGKTTLRPLTAEDHIAVGAHVNARFDGESVRTRMRSLGIPLDRAARKLSGGQRTQLARR
jgi:ABC-type branched-subunit amino acid transport system ATPase component